MSTLNAEIIYRRLAKLDGLIAGLDVVLNSTLEDYLADDLLQAASERRLQLAAQVCIDVANYLIARHRLEIPDDATNVFLILAHGKAISSELANRLKGLVRFRNILVHGYLEVDSGLVYRNIRAVLRDFRDFGREIVSYLERIDG